MKIGLLPGLMWVLLAVGLHAQEKPAVAEPASIVASSGISGAQADAILSELRQIHELLKNQQVAAVGTRPAAVQPARSDKVEMTVGQGWYAMGREDAPVTMVEFTDYQCPFCRRFEADSFAQLKKNYIDTGKVRFVSRDLPLEFHPNAPKAAIAARCAGEQHKFWEMHDAIMQDTATDLGAAALTGYAHKVNLDMVAFAACLNERSLVAAIQKDTADAGVLGISGTPSFVIGKTASDRIDGVRIVGAVPYLVFDSAIKGFLLQ
jgi:protein-disulfide isomerase